MRPNEISIQTYTHTHTDRDIDGMRQRNRVSGRDGGIDGKIVNRNQLLL